MKRSLIKSGLVGAFALALSAAASLAQPGNFGSSEQSQLVQVRDGGGGGGGGHGGGGHDGGGDHHGRGFGGGDSFDDFGYSGGPFSDDGYDSCRWSPRYHRTICY